MMKHPELIDGYLKDASPRFPGKSDEHHFFGQLQCSCANQWFRVWKSQRPTVRAVCEACKTHISVYDLTKYPAATPGRSEGDFVPVVHPDGGNRVRVYVMYEYGDLDPDQTFDRNDVTWCQVYIEDTAQKLIKILDDETA